MKMRSVFPEKVKAYLILGFCVLGVVTIIAVPYFITLSSGFLAAEVADETLGGDEITEETEKTDSEVADEETAETEGGSGTASGTEAIGGAGTANNSEVATSDKAPATQASQTARPNQTTKPSQTTGAGQVVKPEQVVPEEPEEDRLNVDDQMGGDDGFTEVGPIENTDESAGEYTPGAADKKPEDVDNPDVKNDQVGESWGV